MLSTLVTALLMCFRVFSLPMEQTSHFDLHMPQVQPKMPDTYLCHSVDVSNKRMYITEFIPIANKDIAHHILLYGCTVPGSEENVWDCGEMASTDTSYSSAPVCASGSKILYAWAMDAPRLKLPHDVAFNVGGPNGIRYLTLQVHYKNVSSFLEPENKNDSSGLTLITTDKPQKRQAGVYLMVTGGNLPAHSIEYLEAACDYPDDDLEIHPFAFRTHAHKLGRVVSGYRVRDRAWAEIGRRDPRTPQMFYNVTEPTMTLRKGDILAARCTMDNNLDHDVAVGSTQNDEMCNFYIMYYVTGDKLLTTDDCFTQGAPLWYWKDFWNQNALNLQAAPASVSTIPGTVAPIERTAHLFTKEGEPEDDVVFDEVVGDAITKINPSEALEQLIMEQKGDLFDNTLQGAPMSHNDGLFDDTLPETANPQKSLTDLYDYLYNANAV